MFRVILPPALALLLALSWVYFGAPLLFRFAGVKISLNPLKRRKVKLSPNQDIYVSCVSFGVAMFIADISNQYFRWQLYGNTSDRLSTGIVIFDLFGGVFAGVLFGLFLGIMDAIRDLNAKRKT